MIISMKKIFLTGFTIIFGLFLSDDAVLAQLHYQSGCTHDESFLRTGTDFNSFEANALSLPDSTRKISPVDTMHMSLLERTFWGRHGLMRLTHIASLDPNNPVNDFRQMAKARRKMLTWHQALGLATIASMTVTVIGGIQDYSRPPRQKGQPYSSLHRASLPFTIGLYSATATLALSSPPKLIPSEKKWDTISFHKLFAVVHLAGMIVTPMLAPRGGRGGASSNYNSQKRIHEISGLITYGAFTSGMLVVTFFR
jgi:hypothetical protein